MSVMSCPWRTACARHGAHARPARWRVPDGAGSSGTRSGSDGTRHGQRETGPCRTVRRVRGPAVRAGRSTSRHGVAEQPDSRVLLVRGDCGHARRPLRKPAGDKSPEGPEQGGVRGVRELDGRAFTTRQPPRAPQGGKQVRRRFHGQGVRRRRPVRRWSPSGRRRRHVPGVRTGTVRLPGVSGERVRPGEHEVEHELGGDRARAGRGRPRARPAAHQAATAKGGSAARRTHGGTGCEEDSA